MKFPSYGAAGVLAVCMLSMPVLANSKGTGATGNSGKTASMTCITCHTGGASPTVEISGPATLDAGATGQYKLTIRGGAAVKGGMNVAVSNTAASLVPGAGLQKIGSEIIHNAPKDFANGEVSFDFSLTAPSTGGTLTIFGAGNSTNGDTKESGDRAGTAKLDVTVTGGTDLGNGNEDEGGCSATGGAPMLVFALSALTLNRFRRRRS
jgi:uncharacterized protein (TIGR03382 family)